MTKDPANQTRREGAPAAAARRALALKWHLVLLVAGALLPTAAFAAVVISRLATAERAAADRRLLRSAQDLSRALDREIQTTVRTLGALAQTDELDSPDLAAFHAEARRIVASQPGWLCVILLAPDERQLVNTVVEWGTPLPRALDPASVTRVIAQKRPVVGNLTEWGPQPGRGIPVRVPVMRDGEVRYILTAVITTDALAGIVGSHSPPAEEWTRTVVDARGVVVARSRAPERFIGQQVKESYLRLISESDEGLTRDAALDGTPAYVAYSRDQFSGWTAAVAVPAHVLESSARGPVIAVLALGLALFSLSTMGAFLLSRHISRGLTSAARAAETMSRGGRPPAVTSSVREVVQLGRALADSAALLAQRERERNEHLEHADAARHEAEDARRAQEELLKGLRESEERFAKAFEASPLALTITSLKNGRLMEVNETFTRLSGYTREEAVGRTTIELGLWARESDREEELGEVRQRGRVRATEYRFRMKDGTELVGLLSAEQIEIGGEPCALTVIEDITEQKRVEVEREQMFEREKELRARAEEANRLKDEFLATVSHELRTPLTAILGWSHMLERESLDHETAHHAVSVIRRNAEQQRQIVEDLLDMSRVITGKLRLEYEPVEMSPVVQAALDTVRPAADAKGVRLRSKFDARAVITGDAGRLQQVVWNLLANAVKFTPAGGEVCVSAERLLNHVRIEVSDTGQGIAPEFLPFVFDRFRQADSSTTRLHGGLGLGLSLVRHLVEAHGGSVHAYSAGEGQGATFTVDLPLPLEAEIHPTREASDDARAQEQEAAIIADANAGDEAPPMLLGLRVLLTDDERDALEMVSLLLRRAGAEVTAAASAASALDALARVRPDVIVADIAMPGTDGYELIRRVRALAPERGGQTPAVALTSYAEEADRLRALRSGFQAHLAKPVSPEALINTIVNLAGRVAPISD